jgi:CIC family chloride channel protein
MSGAVELLHALLFRVPAGERLSAQRSIDPLLALTVPLLGGLALGIASVVIARYRRPREVDPIEANALHGGRMSLRGSIIVAAQTIWSSGVGASVGLEAGYTQLASGTASLIGQKFRVRRGDLRVLVGCGAAGAIAGGFGAPLAGAFYAFELVIGSYSVASLASVAISALVGLSVAQLFTRAPLNFLSAAVIPISGRDLLLAAAIGIAGALLGIGIMRGVAICEALFVRLRIPAAVRPALGGAVVGLCACVTPQVMSSGHGALTLAGVIGRPFTELGLVLVLKSLASVASLGSGFRGGLFFASLLLGAIGGHLFATGLWTVWPGLAVDPRAYAIIGMGALSASIIGAPLTMTFIALETTHDFQLTAAVLIAVVISVIVTREMFGYSFATWRFHLRGETIRSAADVGWMRDLTVARMMRREVKSIPADISVAAFRTAFPLGSVTRVVAMEPDGRYAGLIIVPEAHSPELDAEKPVRAILHNPQNVLLPTMSIKAAIECFDQGEAEALAVVDSKITRRVVGILTEAHALRRYSEESEMRRRELLGET